MRAWPQKIVWILNFLMSIHLWDVSINLSLLSGHEILKCIPTALNLILYNGLIKNAELILLMDITIQSKSSTYFNLLQVLVLWQNSDSIMSFVPQNHDLLFCTKELKILGVLCLLIGLSQLSLHLVSWLWTPHHLGSFILIHVLNKIRTGFLSYY